MVVSCELREEYQFFMFILNLVNRYMPFIETIAFGAVIDYFNGIGMDKIKEYELGLLDYATEQLLTIPEVTIMGQAAEKEPVLSFSIKGVKLKKPETFLSDEYN